MSLPGRGGLIVSARYRQLRPGSSGRRGRSLLPRQRSGRGLVDLRRRIAATKWPERETVSDAMQGVLLATMQKLAEYWATDYDWRKVEARLNALVQFVTTIDALDIHLIHVRSKHPNAPPVIITHAGPARPSSR